MASASYEERRSDIEDYFDRTAADTWARLTSDAPVGRIRRTVRAGRDTMRETLLSMLPPDLSSRRVLDAGCGTGAMAVELARRGADVVAIDLAPTLVSLARTRAGEDLGGGSIDFRVGDMRDESLGDFDHVVAMDSLIHYGARDLVDLLASLSGMCRDSIVFTFAPFTPLLGALHTLGRQFPRSDRAPSIEPLAEGALRRHIGADARLGAWSAERTVRVKNGFYISQALEIHRR